MSKVYVFLAEGFEEIEALMVVDLLRRAKCDVTTVAIMGDKKVKGRSTQPGVMSKRVGSFTSTTYPFSLNLLSQIFITLIGVNPSHMYILHT